ncbi:uncharacterized protein LOC111476677 [Cucurbita maxima]|uniref:Uncharacterized protein LOC111476677 n=1 Tax=Cucurbita maxima TaxID=3661 RepID=A0A6J1IF74_CUCMA|nr:uncharacterized protein LOC111476677 [Cucurbita maxima]
MDKASVSERITVSILYFGLLKHEVIMKSGFYFNLEGLLNRQTKICRNISWTFSEPNFDATRLLGSFNIRVKGYTYSN